MPSILAFKRWASLRQKFNTPHYWHRVVAVTKQQCPVVRHPMTHGRRKNETEEWVAKLGRLRNAGTAQESRIRISSQENRISVLLLQDGRQLLPHQLCRAGIRLMFLTEISR
ncbi:hypothetical protein CEXT_387131 [Caerostris extrusa]|uniref:Uncharacterized protein n=1 Tax=Caerostris extrusa TaxID=172846 RepID=A0AAV4P5L7_CAEEX|nr:hypothetical protein CEXT_387131 [Caerostris extrusa]